MTRITTAAKLGPLIAGVLFALGLGISGMTQPAKILAFLDITGAWDPTLAFVMVGAIGTHALLSALVRGSLSKPLQAGTYIVPVRTDLDAKLIGGAALFGAGWGLGGYCPGPAIASLASGALGVVVFTAGMMLGMALFELPKRATAAPRATTPSPTKTQAEGNDG